jgi:hypothetical protein
MDKENVACINIRVLLNHKEEFMVCAGKWMELDFIIMSEIRQAQNAKYHVFTHT